MRLANNPNEKLTDSHVVEFNLEILKKKMLKIVKVTRRNVRG